MLDPHKDYEWCTHGTFPWRVPKHWENNHRYGYNCRILHSWFSTAILWWIGSTWKHWFLSPRIMRCRWGRDSILRWWATAAWPSLFPPLFRSLSARIAKEAIFRDICCRVDPKLYTIVRHLVEIWSLLIRHWVIWETYRCFTCRLSTCSRRGWALEKGWRFQRYNILTDGIWFGWENRACEGRDRSFWSLRSRSWSNGTKAQLS